MQLKSLEEAKETFNLDNRECIIYNQGYMQALDNVCDMIRSILELEYFAMNENLSYVKGLTEGMQKLNNLISIPVEQATKDSLAISDEEKGKNNE